MDYELLYLKCHYTLLEYQEIHGTGPGLASSVYTMLAMELLKVKFMMNLKYKLGECSYASISYKINGCLRPYIDAEVTRSTIINECTTYELR